MQDRSHSLCIVPIMSLDEAQIEKQSAQVKKLIDALNQVLFGQEELISLVVTGLLARGHILLEGLPGLGKTELVKGLAKALRLENKRVQFTPDLLPRRHHRQSRPAGN